MFLTGCVSPIVQKCAVLAVVFIASPFLSDSAHHYPVRRRGGDREERGSSLGRPRWQPLGGYRFAQSILLSHNGSGSRASGSSKLLPGMCPGRQPAGRAIESAAWEILPRNRSARPLETSLDAPIARALCQFLKVACEPFCLINASCDAQSHHLPFNALVSTFFNRFALQAARCL